MRDAKQEERHLEAEPDQQAGPHDFLWPEDVRERSAEPRSQGRGGSVGGEDERDLRGAEVKVEEQRRKKSGLDAIADHEEQQAQVADGQLGMHADALDKGDLRLRGVFCH